MSNCCSTSCDAIQSVDVCRHCGARGQMAPRQTLESLLTAEARVRLRDGAYLFDLSPDCDVIYFSNEQNSYFTKKDVQVRVGLKEKEAPMPICYCFGHTEESARQEIEETGRSTVVERIKREIQAGNCACEIKNPSGRCCLGEVTKAVDSILREQRSVAALAE